MSQSWGQKELECLLKGIGQIGNNPMISSLSVYFGEEGITTRVFDEYVGCTLVLLTQLQWRYILCSGTDPAI